MTCAFCAEEILPGEGSRYIANGTLHRECFCRVALGSAEHILKVCTCFRPDATAQQEPDGLTLRERARRSLDAFDRVHRNFAGSIRGLSMN
jgi:hypothetical protein